MIEPVLTQPGADMEEDIDFLFKLCGVDTAAFQFDYSNSLVAIHKGQLVGFVTSWQGSQHSAFIGMILVHPDFRGQRLGYYLMEHSDGIL